MNARSVDHIIHDHGPLSLKEIALLLGMNHRTVSTIFYRAMAKLRAEFERQGIAQELRSMLRTTRNTTHVSRN